MFIPLHVKSYYSLGYGTASIDELVERAAALGYRALALTDLENLYAQVRFHHVCSLHGVKAITGLELRPGFDGRRNPGSREGRVILLAFDKIGYGNLCRIVSRRRAGVDGDNPLALAERYPAGLFILSDDVEVIEQVVARGRFEPDKVGLLLVRPAAPPPEAQRVERIRQLGVRLVADLDAVMLRRDDHALHVLQLAIAQGSQMDVAAAGPDVEPPERWLRPPAGAAALFADCPEAVKSAEEIAESCSFQLGAGAETGHGFNADAGCRDNEELGRLCREGLAERRKERVLGPEYDRRLQEELEVFASLNFSGFMLIVAEILSHCREEGILVAVRGSAVSSLVLHLLGGSPVDPLLHKLIFERFLHRGKSAWPDVDIDLPWHRRDRVIAWVYQRFGEDKVAMVAAHHTFRYRSALGEGLKAWGASDALIDDLTRMLPPEDLAVEEVDFLAVAAPAVSDRDPLRHHDEEPPGLKEILPLIRRLVGRPRHVAVHPGGIVIDSRPLAHLLPLERAPKGVVITQYDLVAVAKLGLVKIDLLGNRCLSEIEETMSLAGWPRPLRLDSIPAEDQKTLDLIDQAKTLGCFQLESPAMRSLLARLPIRRQSDLVAALALIRPGAAAGEVKNTFIRRARGEEKGAIPFPVLADRLRDTYGLPIYEEDVMVLLARAGGVSLAQADELRRGIVKSGGEPKMLALLQGRFLESAVRNFGDDKAALARARKAWGVAARFAAYSFNKAHAASYALLAYYSAYLKAHHPVEFGCALFNHHQGLYPLRTEAAELRRMGVRLLLPHVNHSSYHSACVAADGVRAVRVGLDKVKSLSRRGAAEIEQERQERGPFAAVRDLMERVRLAVHEISALILCGACDGLSPLDAASYPFVHEAVIERLRQNSPLAELDKLEARPVLATAAERARLPLYQALVRVRNELNYLEMHLSAHPIELLRQEADRMGCQSVAQLLSAKAERTARLAAVVAAMRRVTTRQGPMQFVTFEDETGILEAVVFPVAYRRLGERVTTPGPFLVEGKIRMLQGALHLEVGRLEPFHERGRGTVGEGGLP